MAGISKKERERRKAAAKAKVKIGRPSKLDERTKEIILGGVKLFLNRDQCAKLARVHIGTMNRWLRSNEEFRADFEEAEASAIRNATACLAKAAMAGSVPAITTILKAKGGEEWRDQKTIHVATASEEQAVKDAFLKADDGDDEDDHPSQ